MSLKPPSDLEPREKARLTKTQEFGILLRQSSRGADDVLRAFCACCKVEIAYLSEAGKWEKSRPFAFDHELARGLYGETDPRNMRAICDGSLTCHGIKSASDQKRMAKADAQAGRTGQAARRAARKAKGERPQLQSRGFNK